MISASTSERDTSSRPVPYGSDFFADIAQGALIAGRRILPLVLERYQPKSLVDVGCGTGGWAAAALELGVPDVLGIDGDYVDRSQLLLRGDQFQSADLQRPVTLSRRFDMVICTEVGEHLTPDVASALVESLTALGPVVLFSAAIPGQGGTFHINEQWPEYWAAKFRSFNYRTLDWLRPRIWSDGAVPWWYRQNIFLAIDEHLLATTPDLRMSFDHTPREILPLVHPEKYLSALAAHEHMLRAPRALLHQLLRSLSARLLPFR